MAHMMPQMGADSLNRIGQNLSQNLDYVNSIVQLDFVSTDISEQYI